MRKLQFLISVCILVSSLESFAGLSKPIVDYRIKARLVPVEKAVIGRETLTWLNDSDASVSELHFHMYLNAFKNNRSTYIEESEGEYDSYEFDENTRGYIDIKTIRMKEGPDLLPLIDFIQPDDGNEYDQTVMRIVLAEPVLPNEKLTLEIEFYAKLPEIFTRSGYDDDFFMVSQWFPKLGVWENGEWNCHQYHGNSEFFSNFGIYEVDITAPKEYVIGATGKRIKEVDHKDGTKTYKHYQENVHDFAWAASPSFIEFREPYVIDDPNVNTEIILLVLPEDLDQKDRYLESLKNGIEFFSQNYGAYPYSTITLVVPPRGASGAGSMEYPTLVTSATIGFFPRCYYTETVIIHELGHNYWYGMVASNEFEESWLDEGVNTYSEIKAMAKYYGENSSILNLPYFTISDFEVNRVDLIPGMGRFDAIHKKAWEFYDSDSYGTNTYSQAAIMLLTLEKHIGEEVMARVMKTYYERWKFRHPTTEDFIAVSEEVSGQDLDWFFKPLLMSSGTLDYAVAEIESSHFIEPKGRFDGERKRWSMNNTTKMYENEVVVYRNGEIIFPQEISIVFDNDKEIREKWDGKDRWKRFVYYTPEKVKYAHIDPENRVLLDTHYTNNSKTLELNRTCPLIYSLRSMLIFQMILSLI